MSSIILINCTLRSVEINITLEMAKISLHGIVCVSFFYLHNFIQHFGNKARSRIHLIPTFVLNFGLLLLLKISRRESLGRDLKTSGML